MPEENKIIIFSPCSNTSVNTSGNIYPWSILTTNVIWGIDQPYAPYDIPIFDECPYGSALVKDSGCCCCDFNCLGGCVYTDDSGNYYLNKGQSTSLGNQWGPCVDIGTCGIYAGDNVVVCSGQDPFDPPIDTCIENCFTSIRTMYCGPSNFLDFSYFGVCVMWNEGYPEAYRPYMIADNLCEKSTFTGCVKQGNSWFCSDGIRRYNDFHIGYCLFWVHEYTYSYGTNICESQDPLPSCCYKEIVRIKLYKLECETQELVDVTDEAVDYFDISTENCNIAGRFQPGHNGPGTSAWQQPSKGYFVYCYGASNEIGGSGNEDCDCCNAVEQTVIDVNGPPILICFDE